MPDKKPKNLFFYFFAQKKQEDILSVADKVIEDYIYSRSLFIKKSCSTSKKSAIFLSAVCIAAGFALVLYLILFCRG